MSSIKNTSRLAAACMNVLLLLCLSACQAASVGQAQSTRSIEYVLVEGEAPPTQALTIRTPAAQPEQPAAASTASQIDEPVQAVLDYADLLQAGEYHQAASLTSTFSLSALNLTSADVEWQLQSLMLAEKWSAFKVTGSRPLDERTHLVNVRYLLSRANPAEGQAAEEPVEALWAVRSENGAWRINHTGLIDFRLLHVREQTTAGLTVKPRLLLRYTDRVELVMLVQNQTSDPIVLGQANEILATFFFAEDQVQANQTQFIFDRLRSYPETTLVAPGLFEQFPDGVEIRRWKNYNVAPWFTFNFGE